jgi:hypothetical protein
MDNSIDPKIFIKLGDIYLFFEVANDHPSEWVKENIGNNFRELKE